MRKPFKLMPLFCDSHLEYFFNEDSARPISKVLGLMAEGCCSADELNGECPLMSLCLPSVT